MNKASRNTEIITRIKAGEKRSSLATEYGINRYTITRICKAAGLPRWSRFPRSRGDRP